MPEANNEANLKCENELKSARSYLRVANIIGPVSLIIGGILASSIGLVFAFIALYKIKRTAASVNLNVQQRQETELLFKSAKVSLVICGIAFILNLITFIMSIMVLMQFLQNGDLSELLQGYLSSDTLDLSDIGNSSHGSKTWG